MLDVVGMGCDSNAVTGFLIRKIEYHACSYFSGANLQMRELFPPPVGPKNDTTGQY